jgi:DNA-binding NarL/FixJ family response regulator/tetratricopeptide (TPR) repeat protein
MAVDFLRSRFVGRAGELGQLLAAVERAERGHTATVLLAGDAGVGKTRLLAELASLARRRGMQVLIGGCLEVGEVGLPYLPIVTALRGFAADADNELRLAAAAQGLPSLDRLLPELSGEPTVVTALGGGIEQLQLFDAVRALLVRLSEGAPLLMVLEDLHWADRSTRDLLAFLVRILHGRVALVASYRADGLHRRHPLAPLVAKLVREPDVERLELAPFGRFELAEHLTGLRGERVSAMAVERIYSRSQGNPFYAEELLAVGADQADVQLPAGLADVLLSRVEVLSESAQELLRVAAVAGRRVSHRLLVAAIGRPELELEKRLREAVAARLLVADANSESYAFRHALLQEAVYGDLLPGERTRLHATYARLLADAGPHGVGLGSAAELAWHCLRSRDLPAALAASLRAADEAGAVFASAEAFGHLTQALQLWDRVPAAPAVAGLDRVELLLRAAEAAHQSGDSQEAVGRTREAVAAIDPDDDPLRAARAHERLGLYALEGEDEPAWEQVKDETLATCRRAVELVPQQPPTALRARVTGILARALLAAGRLEEAQRWCEEALAVARMAGSAEEESHALGTLGLLDLWLGRVEIARSLLGDARRRAVAAGNLPLELRAQTLLGVLEFDVGNLVVACAIVDEATELAGRAGLLWSAWGLDSRVFGGMAHYAAGNWDHVERLAVAVDHRGLTASLLSAVVSFVEVGRGLISAEERLARLVTPDDVDPSVAYLVGICKTDLARWQGDLDGACAVAHSTVDELGAVNWVVFPGTVWPAALGLAAEADRAQRARLYGDHTTMDEARKSGQDLLDQAQVGLERIRLYGRQVGAEALAWLAKAKAEWTRLEGHSDPEAWQAAVEAFSYGYIYEVARCQWRLAEALLGVGDPERATAAAQSAYQTAVRLGAAPLRAALEGLGRRGRLDLGVGLPAERTLAGLTPRELEVLRLLVEGRSNRQIADQLFISGKTASVHVTNLLAKLGVHSRLEAAATARRLGLDQPAQEDTTA